MKVNQQQYQNQRITMNHKLKIIMKYFSSTVMLLIFAQTVFAQAQQMAPEGEMDMNRYYIILFILFILLLNAIFIPLMKSQQPKTAGETLAADEKKSIISVLGEKLTGLKPIETEKSLLIDEDYDGIQELDNNVPPWFNILFYGTVVIAVIYLINYHVLHIGKLPFQEYADEIYAAELQRNELIRTGAFINETSVELLTDAESMKSGKQIFSTNCVPCHGENAGGTVGPNLTDEYWIHGGGIKNVFKTVKYGVPAKGMIAWQTQFNPKMMQQVSSYVLSLQGTKPLNGKPPEGDKYLEANDSLNVKTDTLKADTLKTGNVKKDSLNTDTTKQKK